MCEIVFSHFGVRQERQTHNLLKKAFISLDSHEHFISRFSLKSNLNFAACVKKRAKVRLGYIYRSVCRYNDFFLFSYNSYPRPNHGNFLRNGQDQNIFFWHLFVGVCWLFQEMYYFSFALCVNFNWVWEKRTRIIHHNITSRPSNYPTPPRSETWSFWVYHHSGVH